MTLSHGSRVTRREGSGGRRDQTEERGGRHEGRERASDMTGQAGSRAGGDEPRGEERRACSVSPIISLSRSGS